MPPGARAPPAPPPALRPPGPLRPDGDMECLEQAAKRRKLPLWLPVVLKGSEAFPLGLQSALCEHTSGVLWVSSTIQKRL